MEKELIEKMKRDGYEVFEIKHSQSLPELFDTLIKSGISTFKKDLILMPAAFIITRDLKEQTYSMMIYPMMNRKEGELQIYLRLLKKFVKELQSQYEPTTRRIVAVIRGMEGASVVYDKVTDLINAKGEVVLPKDYVPPLDHPDAKSMLIFQCEEEFFSHTKFYEYIMSPDNKSVVVSETPTYDTKEPFNAVMDKNLDTSYMFTKPQSQN